MKMGGKHEERHPKEGIKATGAETAEGKSRRESLERQLISSAVQ